MMFIVFPSFLTNDLLDSPLFKNVYIVERPDRGDPAIDSVEFSRPFFELFEIVCSAGRGLH